MIHEWLSSESFLMKIVSMAFDVNSFGKIGTPNSVSWSISAEFFAYLLFPFLLKFIRIGRAFSLVLINIIIGIIIYQNLIPRDGLIRVLFCFTVGLWVRFYLHDFIPEVVKKSKWMGWCALIILLLLLSFIECLMVVLRIILQ